MNSIFLLDFLILKFVIPWIPQISGFLFVLAIVGLVNFFTRSPLSRIPGPILAKFTPLWLIYHARAGHRYLAVHAAHQKYGAVVRISSRHVSLAHKDAIRFVFGQGPNAFDKSEFYDAFVSEQPSVFSTRNRAIHSRKRRNYSSSFSAASVRNYQSTIESCLAEVVEQFDKFADLTSQPWVDILAWANYLAFDVLSDLAFGERLGMARNGTDNLSLCNLEGAAEGAIASVDRREHLASVVGLSPFLRKLAPYLPDPFFQLGKQGSECLSAIAQSCINRRLSSDTIRHDFFERHILSHSAVDIPDDSRELVAEAVTLLIAGSDTTSNSIAAILFLVLTHPPVHQKLLQELAEAGQGTEEVVANESYDGVPYLQDTIHEGLRFFAPTAIGLPRIVSAPGMQFGGYWIPEGTEVSVPSWTIQHDPSIWGPDANLFRPERWSEEPHRLQYLMTFGFGARACLGRHLAMLQMKIVLATLILRYNFILQTDVLESTEGFMHKPLYLWARITRRYP